MFFVCFLFGRLTDLS